MSPHHSPKALDRRACSAPWLRYRPRPPHPAWMLPRKHLVLLGSYPPTVVLCPTASERIPPSITRASVRCGYVVANRMHIGPPSETLKSAARSAPGGIHHRANVVHPQLQSRKVVDCDPIRQAGTALVEHDQTREGRQAAPESVRATALARPTRCSRPSPERTPGCAGLLPHLVGDVDVTTPGVLHVWNVHRGNRRSSGLRSTCSCFPCGRRSSLERRASTLHRRGAGSSVGRGGD